MPSLYVTDDMLTATVNLPASLLPPALQLQLAGKPHTEPARLLTPAHYWRLWRAVADMEARWADGRVKDDIMQEALRRWQAIADWADEHIGDAALREARPSHDARFPRLHAPPLQREAWTPFDG